MPLYRVETALRPTKAFRTDFCNANDVPQQRNVNRGMLCAPHTILYLQASYLVMPMDEKQIRAVLTSTPGCVLIFLIYVNRQVQS